MISHGHILSVIILSAYSDTSPKSRINTAICALFAASAMRQNSCFDIDVSFFTSCICPCVCCVPDCGCGIGDGFLACACGYNQEDGWLDGEGKGAEPDIVDDCVRV